MLPDEHQKDALIDTFIGFNEACNFISAIAIEDLSGIWTRTTVRKGKSYIHNSRSFRQIRSFIEYKARETGIPIIVVDPHNTSRECPECHYTDRRNRPERSRFECISCGFEEEADLVASLNIGNRAAVSQPIVTEAISIIRSSRLQAPKLYRGVADCIRLLFAFVCNLLSVDADEVPVSIFLVESKGYKVQRREFSRN